MREWKLKSRKWVVGLLSVPAFAACSSSSNGPTTDAEFQQEITQGMHDSLQTELKALVQGAEDLQAAAPDHAWDQTDPAVAAMKAAWIQARHAYEEVEGATAPIFPNIDISIDGRVEDFGPGTGTGVLTTTSDMFGDQAMTGLHAVERILYTDVTPAAVVTYESGLGYVPPQSFPKTQQEADEFKNKLCVKVVTDAKTLLSQWQPAVIDIGSAFNGLISLMNEQKEKVTKAGLHQEESRYSQRTMDDLRYNLIGTTAIYGIFQPWIESKQGGGAIDTKVEGGFQSLKTIYDSSQFAGDAFPKPPANWSDVAPSAADLATPFGQLYNAVNQAVDSTKEGSAVFEMNAAASLCGLPEFSGQ
jgi:iron uptake system component EfeO